VDYLGTDVGTWFWTSLSITLFFLGVGIFLSLGVSMVKCGYYLETRDIYQGLSEQEIDLLAWRFVVRGTLISLDISLLIVLLFTATYFFL
jgi:hypothetical protein